MTRHEHQWSGSGSRRRALGALAGFLAGSPLARAQQDPLRDHTRVPRLDELTDAFAFEAVAYARVPRAAFNYTAYGSDSEFTLRRNREAFDWVRLAPNGVAGGAAAGAVQTATEVLGTKMAFPLMISPTAAQVAIHPDGENAMHQGATAAAGTPMIVSNVASIPVGKIAAAAKGPLWFQLYPKREMDANRAVIEEAQAAGCRAIVVTVDQQASYFERSLHDRNLAATPPRRSTRSAPANAYRVDDGRLWYRWEMFAELRKLVKVPLLIKGVLTAEDARLSMEHGLDAVYVSNHGGRALDYAPSTLEVLPEIAAAVNGRVPILFDSGVRRGSDVLKALALGATAVCLGRVPRWGLAPTARRACNGCWRFYRRNWWRRWRRRGGGRWQRWMRRWRGRTFHDRHEARVCRVGGGFALVARATRGAAARTGERARSGGRRASQAGRRVVCADRRRRTAGV